MTDIERAGQAIRATREWPHFQFSPTNAEKSEAYARAVIESVLLEPSEEVVAKVTRAIYESRFGFRTDEEWDRIVHMPNAAALHRLNEALECATAALSAAALAILGRDGSAS